jgi:hypothetical protein
MQHKSAKAAQVGSMQHKSANAAQVSETDSFSIDDLKLSNSFAQLTDFYS